MKAEKPVKRKKEEQILLTFLKRTKEGTYAKIEKSSLTHTRLKAQREPSYNDEEYLYSLR